MSNIAVSKLLAVYDKFQHRAIFKQATASCNKTQSKNYVV